MHDFFHLTFDEIIDLLKNKEITCEEMLNFSLNQIDKYDPILESYISLYDKELLINKAKESDKRWQNGNPKSLIDGIPIAVKDNIHSMGINTTCGSNILKNYDPPFDATSIAHIKENGGIVIGKTNLDEFAMGSTTETSALKNTKNPHDITRVPGGSSGGSAAAISSGMALLALGSDTGGSIRQPASFCGIVGIKPTYGVVSRYGLVAYASSLDQIGTFARDVFGSAALLGIIARNDKKDSTSLDIKEKDYTALIGKDVKGLKIAVFPELYKEGVSKEIQDQFNDALQLLRYNGAVIEEINFDALKYVTSAYYFIATAEACSNLSRYDGVKYGYRSPKQTTYDEMLFSTRSTGFGKEVKKRMLLGNFVLSSGYYDAYYKKAQQVRTYIMDELKKVFEKYDVIATPTTPDTAYKFGEMTGDPLKIYLADVTTALVNLAGVPAISIPCGKVDNLPVGIQLIGKPLSEDVLFQVGSIIEKNRNINFIPELDKLLEMDIKDSPKKEKKMKDEDDAKIAIISKDVIKKVSDSYMQKEKNVTPRVLIKELQNNVGNKVTISGWIHKINSLGGIEFYILRDRTGFTQLVIETSGIDVKKITPESVVEVKGMVTKEDRSQYDNIEIKVEELKIFATADPELPFQISSSMDHVTLPTLLDYRSLSLRNPKILDVFRVQSEIAKLYSEFLRSSGFSEIKTPKIISSGTEGGTNIFEIKYFEKTAFLAQSPQFYKQMMVGSGLERVFEVGPVFRAEIHNTVRHLNEYTSMDFEMGFIKDEHDIIDMHESSLKHIINGLKEKYPDILKEYDVDIRMPENFPRIHFLEALEIASSRGVKDMDGDISPEGERIVCEYAEEKYDSSFVYIVGYPIKKRPMYTMPDERLPGYTRSFDLLFKGLEITTGGQRIHEYEMLRENIIKFGGNPNEFNDYLDAFKFGMPPHGGLGMGLERITMKFLGLKNVREATLFPRDRNRIRP